MYRNTFFFPKREKHNVDPAFSMARMRFPLDGELDFYLKKIDIYLLFENDLESLLIFVLFLKGKQNKE